MSQKKMKKNYLNKIKCYLEKHTPEEYVSSTHTAYVRVFTGCKHCGKIFSSRLERIPNIDINPFS